MKKNLMIFAASTMLLFAACNKEDNNVYTINGDQITFGISMDEPQSADKQTYVGTNNRIWFNAGDQIYVNQVACLVNPQAVEGSSATSSSLSSQAKVTATISSTGSYDFVYPAGPIQFDGTNYTGTFPDAVQAINGAVNNQLDANFPSYPEHSTPLWPMYYGISDISTQTNRIKLLNACSFLAPAYIYGAEFANAVVGPFVAPGTEFGVNADVPTLNLKEVKVRTNIPLYGPAHLDYSTMSDPKMVMDATMPTCGYQVLHMQMGSLVGTPIQYNPNMQRFDIPGMVPIAPRDNASMTLRMSSSFWVSLGPDADGNPQYLWLCHVTNPKSIERATLARNKVNLLKVNFNTIGDQDENDGWSYVTPRADIIANGEGVIRIAGGLLFVSRTRAHVETWLRDPANNFQMYEE